MLAGPWSRGHVSGMGRAVLAAAVAGAAGRPAAAQATTRAHSGLAPTTTQAESAAVLAFLGSLQAAVRRGDRRAVAGLIEYPPTGIGLWDGRRYRRPRTAAAFLRLYPCIFSPGLRRDLAAVTVDSLFANADGVMFANGRVWFRRTGPRATGPYRIVTVNRP